MEMTSRELWKALHSIVLGSLFLLAFSGCAGSRPPGADANFAQSKAIGIKQANEEIARGQLLIYAFGSFPAATFDPETGLPTASRGGGAVDAEELCLIQAHNQRVRQVWLDRQLDRNR